MKTETLSEQIKNHLVAITGLIVAIIALCYNTWRDEQTEKNRNIRQAAFEVLKQLGELQLVVNYAHFVPKDNMGNPVLGWGHLAIVTDLSELLPPPIPEAAQQLQETWKSNWSHLNTSEESTEAVSQEIDNSRNAVLAVIRNLK